MTWDAWTRDAWHYAWGGSWGALVVSGPYYFVAAALYVAGAPAGVLYGAGASKGGVYVAGASAGQVTTE